MVNATCEGPQKMSATSNCTLSSIPAVRMDNTAHSLTITCTAHAQAAEEAARHVVRGIADVQHVWLAPQSSPVQAQQDVTSLLVALRK